MTILFKHQSNSKGLLRITSKFIKKEGLNQKPQIVLIKHFSNCGNPKGNLYYYYFLKQIILVRKGKEINRDSESNGE